MDWYVMLRASSQGLRRYLRKAVKNESPDLDDWKALHAAILVGDFQLVAGPTDPSARGQDMQHLA